jgi:8-oxo-dGTP pyrophosphatase MutT (NUDIX family)
MNLEQIWKNRPPRLIGGTREYAVLCPFVTIHDDLSLLFEVRASSLRRQGGEVCFPGGKMEPGETPEICALRETEEELGIPRKHMHVLGRSDFLCQMGKFMLHPVPAAVNPEGLSLLQANPAEVETTFLVPLDFFRKNPPEMYTYTIRPDHTDDFPYTSVGISSEYQWEEGKLSIPVWHWENRTIWGMTARIVYNLLETMDNAPPS